ncbi:hypothetical protein HY501_02820 [Candidatus Woesearchaeota archaeon]|nr:hypothetical protein [Candidatus Woesearchaeota archaeon]
MDETSGRIIEKNGSIVRWKSVARGFISGSLLVAGAFPLSFTLRAFFVIIGMLVFLDDAIPSGMQPYIVSTAFGLIVGAGFSFAFFFLGISIYYLALILSLSAVFYFWRALHAHKHRGIEIPTEGRTKGNDQPSGK